MIPCLILFTPIRVSIRGVKTLGGHFACSCQGFDFCEAKKKLYFSKRKWKYFDTFNHYFSEKYSKRANSTNHPVWPLICRNKPAINPKWFNSSDINSTISTKSHRQAATSLIIFKTNQIAKHFKLYSRNLYNHFKKERL